MVANDEKWGLEINRNPEGSLYVWCVDIYRNGKHFREIEHNNRALAVKLASSVIEKESAGLLKGVDCPTPDQFRGLILGLAVGDVVGAPVEKASVEDTRRYIDEHVVPGKYSDKLRSTFEGLPFGQYTDDTQLARELLISLVEKEGSFHPEDYAARIARMFEEGTIVGSGGTTRRAAEKLIEGTSWEESGDTKTAGNGSVMRVAPIGMLGNARAALQQSKITHNHPMALAASAFLADMVHQILYESHVKSPLQMLQYVSVTLYSDFISSYPKNPSFQKISDAGSLLAEYIEAGKSTEEVLDFVLGLQDETNWEGISPYALSSTLWAAYSFVTCPDDFGKLLETALWPAGDVDTIAAMAGAMWGARNGSEAIPASLRSVVNDNGLWGEEDLTNLADILHYHIISTKARYGE